MIVEEQGIDFWTRVQIPSGPLKVLQCLGEWCCSTFFVGRAIQMICDVDHSEVISARLIDSPVLGPRQLCSVAFTVRRTERRVVDIKIGSCHRW